MTGQISHTLVRALGAVPAFSGLDDATLCSIVGASSNLVWRSGSPIFRDGEPAEALYIVLSGSVRVLEGDGREVARFGPGDFFGERSLLQQTSHSRRAEAIEDSEVMVVPKQPFEDLLADDPALGAVVREAMERRLRAMESGAGLLEGSA
jgi:CRP-like cAMP-binding protein